MSNSELIAELEQGLRQARAIRSRLALRFDELKRDINLTRNEINEVESIISSTQSAMVRLTSSVCATTAVQAVAVGQVSAGTYQTINANDSVEFSSHCDANIEVLSDRFSERTIPESAAVILSEAGGPLHVNEIYTQMIEGGYVFTSDNPTISIAGSLNRNSRFRKVAPNTFDLVLRGVT